MLLAHYYILIKHLHQLTVIISISFFLFRYILRRRLGTKKLARYLRIIPHVNDTFLFITGVLLIIITHFYPFSPQGFWLTIKLALVLIYIVLGHIALSLRWQNRRLQVIAFIGALACLVAIVCIAMVKMLA